MPAAHGPGTTIGVARRRTPSEHRRHRQVHLRFSEAEHDLVATAARAEGVSLPAYAAAAALGLATGQRTPVPTTRSEQWQALVTARLEAQRIRDHLAQLAATLATSEQPAPEQLAALIAATAAAVTHLDRAAISFHPAQRHRQ